MGQLQLNEKPYDDFYGRNIDQMPALIAEGRVPMSVNGLMQRRLEVQDKGRFSDEVRSAWHDNYFDTGDGVVYHPDGRIKVVHDAKFLRELNPQSKLNNGALVLPDGTYDSLAGQEFTREEISKYVERSLSSKEAKSNPLWQALARDPNLLNDYVDFVFAEKTKRRFSYDQNMGLYVADKPKDEQGRSWYVLWLEDRSSADGRDRLV